MSEFVIEELTEDEVDGGRCCRCCRCCRTDSES